MSHPVRYIIVMGVSGSGKTTVGQLLAGRLGWDYYEADSFHPAENITKMTNGIPLTDADRVPWLDGIRRQIVNCRKENRRAVFTCSALKQKYRDHLSQGDPDIRFVHLKGSFDEIWARMSARKNHYMKANMLQSQFDALEEPADALVVGISQEPEQICNEILSKLTLENNI